MVSIVLSAVVGAFVALVFGEWREARQRVREKSGLAKLLLAEMKRNSPDSDEPTVVVDVVVDIERNIRHEIVQADTSNLPRLDAWRETRTRVAQLFESQDFVLLADYYQILQTLSDNPSPSYIKLGEIKESQVWRSELPEQQSWGERTEALQKRLRRYADPPSRVRLLGF